MLYINVNQTRRLFNEQSSDSTAGVLRHVATGSRAVPLLAAQQLTPAAEGVEVVDPQLKGTEAKKPSGMAN